MDTSKIPNGDYNKCLKALGAAVGIEKKMHSHLARHSFATKKNGGEPCGDSERIEDAWGHKHHPNSAICEGAS